jgi:uncharacterized protein (DUF952 family)
MLPLIGRFNITRLEVVSRRNFMQQIRNCSLQQSVNFSHREHFLAFSNSTDQSTRWTVNPDVIFKVLPAADWRAACLLGRYDGSDDDRRDGFIHFSTACQLAGTLVKYFRGRPDLVLVAFGTAAVGAGLKFEPSRGGDLFPHLYGPLPTALALWQRPLELGPDGVPLVKEEWLEC